MLLIISLQNVKLSLNFYLLLILVKEGQAWVEKLAAYCYVRKGMKICRKLKIKIDFAWMAWPTRLDQNHKQDIWQPTKAEKVIRRVLCLILQQNTQKNVFFVTWQGDNVVTVHGDKSVSKTPPFEITEHWSVKKEDITFLES